jgi:hypothetical protein
VDFAAAATAATLTDFKRDIEEEKDRKIDENT